MNKYNVIFEKGNSTKELSFSVFSFSNLCSDLRKFESDGWTVVKIERTKNIMNSSSYPPLAHQSDEK